MFEETRREVLQGWATGPHSEEDLDKEGGWLCARRFGIMQSSKLRVVDDYSEPFVNATFAAQEKNGHVLPIVGEQAAASRTAFAHNLAGAWLGDWELWHLVAQAGKRNFSSYDGRPAGQMDLLLDLGSCGWRVCESNPWGAGAFHAEKHSYPAP